MSETFAYKVRSYDFVEFCMEADVTVHAKSVALRADAVEIVVKATVYGELALEKVQASFTRAWRDEGAGPREFSGERLVFLSLKDGKYALVGEGTQSIWPQEYPATQYPSAGDIGLLVKLCKQIREFTSLAEAKRLAAVNDMVAAKDPFLKLVGFDLCSWLLRRHHGEKYVPEVELGSAYAVAFVQHPWRADLPVFYRAVALSSAAPPSAGLQALLRGIEHRYIDQAVRNSAIIGLVQIAHRSGAPLPTLPNVEPVTLDGKLSAIKEWLSKAWPGLVRADAEKILAALVSDDPLRRMVGRMWLEACAAGRNPRFCRPSRGWDG
ncbi:MAG: hypothetical protein FJ290_03175 [Planctomycetes bacterium]|nr:hypothetical protein [Planctomycetota bacterium]